MTSSFAIKAFCFFLHFAGTNFYYIIFNFLLSDGYLHLERFEVELRLELEDDMQRGRHLS